MEWLQETVGTDFVLSRTDDVSETDRFAARSGFVSPSRRACSLELFSSARLLTGEKAMETSFSFSSSAPAPSAPLSSVSALAGPVYPL